MKKTINILFAFAMILSIAFIGDALSSNGSLSVKAQTGQATVRRRRTGGVVGSAARGTRYAAHKTKRAGKYVAHKSVRGTMYAGKKTVQGTKYTAHKTKVVTKNVGKKTVNGTKSVFSKTKKVVVGDN